METRPPPRTATTHRPGSAGKIEVMRQRYAAGEHIHHADDESMAKLPDYNFQNHHTLLLLPAGVTSYYRQWRARPWDPRAKRHVHLGLFATIEEAVEAIREFLED